MKPRHVRRLAVALAACGVLLAAASCVLTFFDGEVHNELLPQHHNRDGIGEDPDGSQEDDPGGFRRFQDELVRRKEEEVAERGAMEIIAKAMGTKGSEGGAAHGDGAVLAPVEDTISVSEEDAASFVRVASRWNEQRLRRVQEVCARHNLGLYRSSARAPDVKIPPTPQYAVFYYDRSHKMAWCPLYKAGSTSLLYNLCLLGGYSERELRDTKEQLSTLARKAYPELEYPEAEEALRESRKVLVVRHPFARLLSAYRDKLENRVAGAEHGTAHFYRKYGRRIVERYRAPHTATSALLRPDQVVRDRAQPPPAGDEPTFREFVQYLIDVDLASYADDHWIPYYLFCTPCLVNYDFVAKVETYLEDQVYMIRALGLQDSVRPRWRHRTSPAAAGSAPEAAVDATARKYFSQISENQLRALHDKFRLDFELFDYAMEDYLPFVSNATVAAAVAGKGAAGLPV